MTSIVMAIEERIMHFPKGLIKSLTGIGQPLLGEDSRQSSRVEYSSLSGFANATSLSGREGDPAFCIQQDETDQPPTPLNLSQNLTKTFPY
jgi:hypothetical protein